MSNPGLHVAHIFGADMATMLPKTIHRPCDCRAPPPDQLWVPIVEALGNLHIEWLPLEHG